MNAYNCFYHHVEKASEYRDKIEADVTEFIRDEWNKDLNLCVELEDTGVLTICVWSSIEKEYFYQFIIQPVCEAYGLKLQYTEVISDKDGSIITWGLARK